MGGGRPKPGTLSAARNPSADPLVSHNLAFAFAWPGAWRWRWVAATSSAVLACCRFRGQRVKVAEREP